MSQPFDNRDWDLRRIGALEQEIERLNEEIKLLKALLARATAALDNGQLAILQEMREAAQ